MDINTLKQEITQLKIAKEKELSSGTKISSFNEDELLSIARHPFLTGDPVLGELAEMRFKPEVFDSNGIPLDERGEPSPDRACPVCHLRFPEKLTDKQ